MNRNFFNYFRFKKADTRWRKSICPEEKLAIFLSSFLWTVIVKLCHCSHTVSSFVGSFDVVVSSSVCSSGCLADTLSCVSPAAHYFFQKQHLIYGSCRASCLRQPNQTSVQFFLIF
ncbi:unnamed protein product [Acanthoscelides obtectus]|nr:unnamed protein product [Acanthoscelides obtectus]CAK1683952.1 hypothetical protein AOBTE_LOCUS34546 [Acanthoscelides obtectus]